MLRSPSAPSIINLPSLGLHFRGGHNVAPLTVLNFTPRLPKTYLKVWRIYVGMEQNTKARQQAYYIANKDRIKAYYREWYQKNKDSEHLKERVKLSNALYLAKNKQHVSENKRRYYLENFEHITRYRREYQEKNKEWIAQRVKELRRYHQNRNTIVSTRRCVSFNFDLTEFDVIAENIKTTNPFKKRNPIATM